eukprot:jgi/Galph1/680/GphlegSOOS_G5387.1
MTRKSWLKTKLWSVVTKRQLASDYSGMSIEHGHVEKELTSEKGRSPIDVAKTYMDCIASLTEWTPSELRSSMSGRAQPNGSNDEKRQSLLTIRNTSHNTLWEILKSPPTPQKMKLFSVRQITQIVIQSLANQFAEVYPSLDLSRKARMIVLLAIDFPTSSSALTELYSIQKPSSTATSLMSSQEPWDEPMSSNSLLQKVSLFYPGVDKYYGWFFYWNFFSLLLNHRKGFEILCDVRHLLSSIYSSENIKELEDYFMCSRSFKVASDSISWLIKYNHRVLATCFGQSFLKVQQLNANAVSFTTAYSRALKRVSSVRTENEAERRLEQIHRKVFVLTQIALPKTPLSFCEVVFLPQPATSFHQIEQFMDSSQHNQSLLTHYPTIVEHVRTFMLPRMNFSRILVNKVMREELSKWTDKTTKVYSLSRLGDFVDWLWRHFILKMGPREFPIGMPKDIHFRVERILSVIYGNLNNQPLKPKHNLSPQDYEILEEHKELLLSLCALYICYAKRLKGLPYDSLATFHLGNGAELSNVCWMADDSPAALCKNLCMMALFSYDLAKQEENVILFSTEGRISVSDAVKGLLDRLPSL